MTTLVLIQQLGGRQYQAHTFKRRGNRWTCSHTVDGRSMTAVFNGLLSTVLATLNRELTTLKFLEF